MNPGDWVQIKGQPARLYGEVICLDGDWVTVREIGEAMFYSDEQGYPRVIEPIHAPYRTRKVLRDHLEPWDYQTDKERYDRECC